MRNGYKFNVRTNEENLRGVPWTTIERCTELLFNENGVNVPRVAIRSVKSSNIVSLETRRHDVEIVVEVFITKKWYERITKENINLYKSFITQALCTKDEEKLEISVAAF